MIALDLPAARGTQRIDRMFSLVREYARDASAMNT